MIFQKKAFSLVEILVGILIISIVMVAGFQALSAIGIGKVKLIESTKIEKESYFLAERFFEMIKKWGTLDYEEYWNRSTHNTSYQSWHYLGQSWFWNFWNLWNPWTTTYGTNLYYCVSSSTTLMGTGGCLSTLNRWAQLASTTAANYNNTPQRYGQYELQFIDYNSDKDIDNGDEDSSGEAYLSFKWDDDDLYLGNGPEAFSGSRVTELYLKNLKWDERTFFRWHVIQDPNAPSWAICTWSQDMTGSGCLWTIQILKLTGKDYGHNHTLASPADADGSQNDGVIDTWLVHPDFHTTWGDLIAGSTANSYWRAIFPDSVSVMDVEFHAFPNKSSKLAWKEAGQKYQIAPYIQVEMSLSPSWKEKKKIEWKIPKSEFITTIGLTDLDFR